MDSARPTRPLRVPRHAAPHARVLRTETIFAILDDVTRTPEWLAAPGSRSSRPVRSMAELKKLLEAAGSA
ncbi:MAG: hypothetical protein LCH60_06715 [Actinobacteria bacterium]|nr:hypothetical protein [Actinomycetota bacterium]